MRLDISNLFISLINFKTNFKIKIDFITIRKQ